MAYPAGAVRLTAANDTWTPAFLHKDHLGSVRAISGPDGTPEERTLYRPYGAQSEVATATLNDDKSWLGTRYDAGAGLQYLNARYYDPELAMFYQPDWFEVMQPGVGTNRYSYSFGDPVNKMDPGGNCTDPAADQCTGDWDDEESEEADHDDDGPTEDDVADASIYDGKDRYVIDPKTVGLDKLMRVGSRIQSYIKGGKEAYLESRLKAALDAAVATGQPQKFEIDGLGISAGLTEKSTTEAGKIFGNIKVDVSGTISADKKGNYVITGGTAEVVDQQYNFEQDSGDMATDIVIGIAGGRPNSDGPVVLKGFMGGGGCGNCDTTYSQADIATVVNRVYNFTAWGRY